MMGEVFRQKNMAVVRAHSLRKQGSACIVLDGMARRFIWAVAPRGAGPSATRCLRRAQTNRSHPYRKGAVVTISSSLSRAVQTRTKKSAKIKDTGSRI